MTPKRKSFIVYRQRTKFVHENDLNFTYHPIVLTRRLDLERNFRPNLMWRLSLGKDCYINLMQRLNLEKDSDHTSQSTKPRGGGDFLQKFDVTTLRRVAQILNFVWFNFWKNYIWIKWVSEIVKNFFASDILKLSSMYR